jgi:hypothetical protein
MPRRFLLIGFLATAVGFFSPYPAVGQVIVEENVTTDTVDLFAATKSGAPQKSGIVAMGASLLLPGLGQQYLGQKGRALAYFSAEALFIFGAVFCTNNSAQVFNNAKAFAWEHANVTGGAGADDQFWKNVRYYDESDGLNQSIARGYNKEQELINRNQEKDYLASNLQWRWDDPSNRKTYGTFLDRSQAYQVAASFFIGAMVLDRLVSFVDARFAAQHQVTSSRSALLISPRYDPRNGSSGLSVAARF